MPVHVVKRDGKWRLADDQGNVTPAKFDSKAAAERAQAAMNIAMARARGAHIPRRG